MRERIQELLQEQKEDVRLKALRHFYLGKAECGADYKQITFHDITKKGDKYIFNISIVRCKDCDGKENIFKNVIPRFFGVTNFEVVYYKTREITKDLKGKKIKILLDDQYNNPGCIVIKLDSLEAFGADLIIPRFWYKAVMIYGRNSYNISDMNDKIHQFIQERYGIFLDITYRHGHPRYIDDWNYFKSLPEIS